MKVTREITRNDILRKRKPIVWCYGYNENLYWLNKYIGEVGRNNGVYGWNYDVLDLGEFILLTGVRHMIGISVDDIVNKYEYKARKLTLVYYSSYEVINYKQELLYKRFKKEVMARLNA